MRRVQRAVGRTALAGDARLEEGVGDGRRGVPHEERGLQRDGEALHGLAGPRLVELAERPLDARRQAPVVRKPDLVEQRGGRLGLAPNAPGARPDR